MGSSASPISAATVAASESAGKATQTTVQNITNDPRLAAEHAARTVSDVHSAPPAYAAILGFVVSHIAEFLAAVVDKVTQVKQQGQPGIHDLIAALLSDSLLIEIDAADIPTGSGAGGQFRINAALGQRFLNALKTQMGGGGAVTGDSAEAGAAALLGLGMQMSVNTAFMALIGGIFPEVHLDELKELGEMLEKSLGLGRLTRQAMRPYIRNMIAQPLDRKMRAQFRQDLPAVQELITGMNAGRLQASDVKQWMAEHGFSDAFITELIIQKTPRLSAEELYTLGLFQQAPTVGALNTLIADGIPTDVAEARLRAIQLKAALAVERDYVKHVDALVTSRVIDTTTGSSLLQGTTIPAQEVTQYQQKWDLSLNNPAKRLGMGEMLFLFEASQLTLSEVAQWAAAEGYTEQDSNRLQLYFELKAVATAQGKAKSQAAAAAHVHQEHIAYVNDAFEGAQGRAPTAAELSGWVALLDNKQRTKGDAKTEIKLDPTPPTQ